jgi:hypothetical protein
MRSLKFFTISTLAFCFVIGTVFAFSGTVSAANDTGLDKSPVFEGDTGHWTNTNNEDVRFDTETHRRAVPGKGGVNSNENSVVYKHKGASLVDPHRTW